MDPLLFDVTGAYDKKGEAEGNKHRKGYPGADAACSVNGTLQEISAVGQGQDVGNGAQKRRQAADRNKQTAQKHHREAEKIRECLSFEYLADRDGNKKTQKSRGDGNQDDCSNCIPPVDARKVRHK